MGKNVKFECPCGKVVYGSSDKQLNENIKTHLKSKKHKEYERLKKFFEENKE